MSMRLLADKMTAVAATGASAAIRASVASVVASVRLTQIAVISSVAVPEARKPLQVP